MSPDDNKDFSNIMRVFARYSHLGITFALTILIGVFAGQYADRKLSTEPYLTLAGAVLGMAGGFYYIIKELVMRQNEEDNEG